MVRIPEENIPAMNKNAAGANNIPPEIARPLVERFAELLRGLGVPTQTGEFGAHMLVEIENDGPVTILLER